MKADGDDVLVRHAHRPQQQHGQHAGAILAGRAVEHRRERVGAAELLDGLSEAGGALAQHVVVGPLQEGHRIVGLQPIEMLPRAVDHRYVVEVDRVVRVRKRAAFGELGIGAQIDDGAQPQLADQFQVVAREALQPIGAKQRAPASAAAIGSGVAAEVAEVVHCVEPDEPARVAADIGEGGCTHGALTVSTAGERRRRAWLNGV